MTIGMPLRLGGLVLATLCLLCAMPRLAHAHGGTFQPPPIWNPDPSRPPPGRRQPGDTTPPPVSTPGQPPGPTTQTEDPERTWGLWWTLNRHRFLARPVPRPPSGPITPSSEIRRRSAHAEALDRARARIAPFLQHLLAAETEDADVRASALLALAKVSNDDAALETILRHVRAQGAPAILRSSAALALGLLRRTDPERQRDGASLDGARDDLFAVIDESGSPRELRTFAALSLGLLADQPHAGAIAKDGKLVTRGLWMRIGQRGLDEDVRIALFTALGLQPASGVPDDVRHSLEQIVIGRAVHRHRWSDLQRSHALSAQLRLGGPAAYTTLARVISHGREVPAIRRAAYLGIGHLADRFAPNERFGMAQALLAALQRTQEPFSRGLGLIAVGHLLGADLRAGDVTVLRRTKAGRLLLNEVQSPQAALRSFAVLALGLAARTDDAPEAPIAPFVRPARRLLVKGLSKTSARTADPASFMAAVGLARAEEGRGILRQRLEDDDTLAWRRTVAALALGALEGDDTATRAALARSTVSSATGVPPAAARAFASLGGELSDTPLIEELASARREARAATLLLALGRLQDPEAAGPLIDWARNGAHADTARAFAVVALGLLGDPEPRPSLARITRDGNYPARTKALAESWSLY